MNSIYTSNSETSNVTVIKETASQKVIFVDSRVPDLQTIIDAAQAGVKVVVLDPNQNGIEQMLKALEGMHDVESISIVSHGDPGVLLLGNGPLFSGNVDAYAAQLQMIGQALSADGDILLYGCDVGAGVVGDAFIAALANATGADVAASNNSTGGANGDWVLEIATGTIESAPTLKLQDLSGYSYVLHTASVSTVAQLKAAIAAGVNDGLADTITITGNITYASAADAITINVTDGQTMSIVGGGFTLSGNNLARVVDVTAGSVAISNLTITNGFVTGVGGNSTGTVGTAGTAGGDALGAGIRNAGTLTITSSVITGNNATGGGGGGNGYTGGGGGGGGGVGTTFGGVGGKQLAGAFGSYYAPSAASAGDGGNGGGFSATGGRGGSTTTGGAGGVPEPGYTAGGAGATATVGGTTIGGGGGGTGSAALGGRGGNAVGGIYNTGTITITSSSITNNLGAGGGGGGGASSYSATAFDGGAGGAGTGGIWNVGGTAQLDASTNTTLSTGNQGSGGTGGAVIKAGSTPGATGAATSTIVSIGGGTQNTNYIPTATITSVNSSTTNGSYKEGDVISIQVAFSEAVTVTGTPQLTLETGTTDQIINYASGSGSSTLTFTYTVQAGDTTADLDYQSTTALALNGGTIKNSGGASSTLTLTTPGAANSLGANKAIVIDTTSPTVSSANSSTINGTYKIGDFVSVQVNFSEAVTVTGTPQLTLETGTTDQVVNYASGNGTSTLTFTYTVQAGDTSADLDYQSTTALALNGGTIKDAAGNNGTLTLVSPGAANSLGANKSIVIDGVAPTVSSVNSSTTNGTYKIGDILSVQVNFSEAVTVTGTPQLTLETGTTDQVVNYASGSGTSTLTFTYTVQAGDTSSDLDYQSTTALALNGGTIKDAAGNNGTLTLVSPGAANSLGANKSIVIDGVAPTVSSVNSSTTNGTYGASSIISVQVNFSEAVTVTGTPQLTLETGTTDRIVNYASGSGTSTLTFTYTVQVGDASADLDYQSTTALALNGGTIKDAAGNNGTLTLVSPGAANSLGSNKAIVIDAAPSIQSATYDASTGVLSVSASNIVGGDTIDVSKLSVTGEGGSYTLTTGNVTASSSTAFSVILNAADKINVNGILNKNGTSAVDTTTFNLAAAANWDQTTTSSADLTGNGVTVSNVTAPTITSATYDGTTHVFTVTGTNLVQKLGAINDITVSALTITGEGGATRTLSTTGNVEITSATSFTFTLAGADIAAVDSLLNKNGTTSASNSTTYNLAVADDWNSVITAGNIADLTDNGITVSNAAPSILSSTYDAVTGILSVSAVNIVGGDTIDVSKFSVTGEAGSYTLTTASVTASSSTAFAVTLSAADKLAINGILNKNGTSAVDTTTFNLSAAANWDQTTTSSADLTGNGVTVSNVIAPTITSATYNGTTHVLTVTGTNLVQKLGATNDITVSALTITGEGGATRTLSTTSNVEITSDTSFTITLAGADQTAVEALFNKNGSTSTSGTTYNLSAIDDWNSVITGGNIADATNAITVSNVAIPTITSSTYDASTGVLTVTGVDMKGLTGAANDIVANKFSLQGEGGASYTFTNTSNVELTSATSFTMTLSAADKASANLIMNKNGISSTSVNTYNLIAAEDWNAGADAAVVIADLTGNGITVSNVVAPTVISATYNVATGILSVTGNNFLTLAGASNDITANRIHLLGQGAFNYTLTDTANVEITSSTSFTMIMSATDKAALALRMNKDGTASTDTTTYNLGMLEDWNAGAATAVVIVDLFGNPVTVTGNNVAPTIGGAVGGQAVNENATVMPFASMTIVDPDVGAMTSATINVGVAAKGVFTSASLAATGFSTADGGLNYTHAAATPAAMQAAIRALVFQPVAGRVAIGATETTAFTVTISDGIAAAVNNTATTVIATGVNAAPTGITLSNSVIGEDAGDNAVVGTLGAIDINPGDTHTYSLVPGGANNSQFNIVGNSLSVNNPVGMGTSEYSILVRVTDLAGLFVDKTLNVTVQDTIVPSAYKLNIIDGSQNGSSVDYLIQFTEPVSGVDLSDFSLVNTGTVQGRIASIQSVHGSLYKIHVNQISGVGTLRLDLNNSNTDIVDSANLSLIRGISGQVYVVNGDIDGDNIPDNIEANVPNLFVIGKGDGNGDGIADTAQKNVTSLLLTSSFPEPNNGGEHYLTFAGQTSITQTKVITTGTVDDAPIGLSTPYGQLIFQLDNVPLGSTVKQSIFTENLASVNGYWAQNKVGEWVNLANNVSTIDGKTRVDFKIQDGGEFDLDGIVNGKIDAKGAIGFKALTGNNKPIGADWDGDGIPDQVELTLGTNPIVKDNDVLNNSKLFAMQLYRDVLFREADTAGVTYWADRIDSGGMGREQVAASFMQSSEFQKGIGSLARLYFGTFDRVPDRDGLDYWIVQQAHGMSLSNISQSFVASTEFQQKYGTLDNSNFIDQIYQNILGRTADSAGKQYWTNELGHGLSRGDLLASFTESAEFQAASAKKVGLTLGYVGLLGHAPDPVYFNDLLNQPNTDLVTIIGTFIHSDEYIGRFMQ